MNIINIPLIGLEFLKLLYAGFLGQEYSAKWTDQFNS